MARDIVATMEKILNAWPGFTPIVSPEDDHMYVEPKPDLGGWLEIGFKDSISKKRLPKQFGGTSPKKPHIQSSYLHGCFEPAVLTEYVDKDRKSTRLNSSHQIISYAVFCLKKKN